MIFSGGAMALGAGLGLIGGERSGRRAARSAELDRRAALQMHREGMDETVQRRVADARAAQISPLAALGTPGASPVNLPPSQSHDTLGHTLTGL